MWYTLTLEARDGSRRDIRYNPHSSEIEGIDLGAIDERDWPTAPRVSKETPLGKSRAPKVLKIQLGLSCNYSCSYCSQAHQIGDATLSKLTDVEAFLENLDVWLEGTPERIELWGGEPFVYWAKLKRLIPALAERFPAARFLIITNGSLLDREKLDLIHLYDIDIGLSHDGPGQDQRGPGRWGGDRTLSVMMEFRRCQSPIGHLEAVVGLGFLHSAKGKDCKLGCP